MLDKSGGPGACPGKFWHSKFPEINSEQIWYKLILRGFTWINCSAIIYFKSTESVKWV